MHTEDAQEMTPGHPFTVLLGGMAPTGSPEVRGTISGIRAALRAEDAGVHPGDPGAATQRFLVRLDAEPATTYGAVARQEQTSFGARTARRRIAPWSIGIAAMVGGIVLALYSARSIGDRASGPLTSNVIEHRTEQGQRATIVLPDSSRVILAPHTTIRYASAFGTSDRTVFVDGEAFFQVTHHAPAVFTVRTAAVTSRVLGTEFGVRAYAGDVRVAVNTGKVAVLPVVTRETPGIDPAARGVAVTAGNVVQLHDGQLAITRGNAAQLLAWTGGNLVFTDAPVRIVVNDLERWFGLRITFADPTLADMRLSGTLQTETGQRMAVQFVAAALGVKYRNTRHDGEVEFYR